VVGLIMLSTLGLAMALTLPAVTPAVMPTPAVDTIVELRRGDRVVLENLRGEIAVDTWSRDALEVRGEISEPGLVVRRTGAIVRVGHDERKGRRGTVEAVLRVPAWVDLEAGGPSLELRVDGVAGAIVVRNVRGDVWIRDASGPVEVRSVEGEIDVQGASAGVSASSQSEDVRLSDVRGTVTAHSGSGDLTLLDIRSASVRAETQDGDIEFSGTIDDSGDYRFFVHDGDAVIAIPPESNARVSVSTFDGEFESEFPVLIERFTGGREFDFTVNEARARIEIQVFDGEIRLLRR
jgi:hypothetical protein